jgi:hypothetical protein
MINFSGIRTSEYIARPTPVLNVGVSTPVMAQFSSGSSLIQVETNPDKLLVIASSIPNHDERPVARRRPRPREIYVESEPLVQIETRH